MPLCSRPIIYVILLLHNCTVTLSTPCYWIIKTFSMIQWFSCFYSAWFVINKSSTHDLLSLSTQTNYIKMTSYETDTRYGSMLQVYRSVLGYMCRLFLQWQWWHNLTNLDDPCLVLGISCDMSYGNMAKLLIPKVL